MSTDEKIFRAGGRAPTAAPGTLRRFVPYKLRPPVNMPLWLDVSSGVNGSMMVLTQNDFRASLTIQNESTVSTLYFGWAGAVDPITGLALGPGRGVIYDVVCPQSPLYLYMNSPAGTTQMCQVMEISYE